MPLNRRLSMLFPCRLAGRFYGFSLAIGLVAVCLSVSSVTAVEIFFTGASGSDYDTGSNWSSGAVPASPDDATIGDDVNNSSAVANLMTTPVAPNDFRIGKNGASGELNHSAGTLTTNNWVFIGVDSSANGASSGTYNLTGTASYVQDTTGERRFEIGSRGDLANPAQGLVHVDTTGSITTNNTSVGGGSTGAMAGQGGSGRFELVNGVHNATGFLNIGNGFDGLDGGAGVYEQTGGELNVNGGIAPFGAPGWFSIANGSQSTGTYNISGGSLNQTIDFLTIGDNGNGTMNVDGTSGTPDVNVGAGGMIVGRNPGSTGMLSVVSDGATIDTTNLIVGLKDNLEAGGVGTLSFTSASGVSPIFASLDVILGDANLIVDLETNPVPFDDVLLVDVGGSLMGEFNGLSEGAAVPGSGGRFITYAYGDGNDIALIVPEPSAVLMLILAAAGGVYWRRRR